MGTKLKCRWCNYQVWTWWSTRKGEPRSGHHVIDLHCQVEHPNKYAQVMGQVDASMAATLKRLGIEEPSVLKHEVA
jgi:hypothetical protein